jgi:CAAX protease family protein
MSATSTPSQRRYDSPVTDWPWWFAPVGLIVAIALTLAAALIVEIPASLLGAHFNAAGEPPGSVELIDTLLQDVIFVLTAVMFARSGLRRVRSSQFGLVPTPRRRAAALVVVVIILFLAFTLVWAELLKSSTSEKLLEQLGANEAAALLLGSAVLTCVVAPICEEILFRGFIFTSLRNWRGPWPAAVLTALVFGAVHAASAPEIDLLPLAFLGFLLCMLYRATGSLYPCIVAHALNNSLAFGDLEKWSWQIPVLFAAALAAIYALVLIAKRLGLIEADAASLRPSPS